MKIKFLVILSLLLLSACSKKTYDVSEDYVMPDGLKDCKIFRVESGGLNELYITRCNSSVSTTRPGKHAINTITTEDEYQPKEIIEIDNLKYKLVE